MTRDTQRLDPGFDPRIADWLEADPDRAPGETLDTILASLSSVQQRPAVRVPWRLPIMLTPPRVVMAVVLGALLIGGVLVASQRPDRTEVASPAPPPSILPSARPALPTTAPSSAVVTVTPTPRPKLIAFETHKPNRSAGNRTVWVEREDGSDSHELLPDLPGSQLIGRVPDLDQVLVLLREDERLMALVDLADGQIHAIPKDCPSADCWADGADVFGMGRRGISLSADGRQAAMVLSDRAGRTAAIGIVDLATGSTSVIESTRVRIGPLGYGLSDPRLSPDSGTIAYLLPDARDSLKCWHEAVALMVVDRFDGSPPRRLVSSDHCPWDPAWSPSGSGLLYTSDDTRTTTDSSGHLFSHELHDVYLVSVRDSRLRRLTHDRKSGLASWTADGRIAYTVVPLDSGNGPAGFDVWILDPATGHRTQVPGTLQALGEAGCLVCPFQWSSFPYAEPPIGFWPRE